jgi:hypothetical protein
MGGCSLTCLAADRIDVILVAGQSNAVGYDAPPSELPPDVRDADVKFWWRCGDPPPDQHDSTSDGWTTLRPQTLGNPIVPRQGRQYGNFGQPSGGFGPEMGLARELVRTQATPLAIIKVAFSGTHAAGDWNPKLAASSQQPTEDDSRGACYRSLVEEVRRALDALRPEYEPNLVALVWVQGESDANAQRAGEYQQHMAAMITSLRSDLSAPEMYGLLGVNTAFQSNGLPMMKEVVEAQQAYCDSDPLARYVDTSGATIANPYHFDAAGTIEVGKRFATAVNALRNELATSSAP